MRKKTVRTAAYFFVVPVIAVLYSSFNFNIAYAQTPYHATTSVYISICGDAIVQSGEGCDDGVNIGGYSTSTATRSCLPGCSAFGPYCGDQILQPLYAEECDDGNNVSGDKCSVVCQNEQAPVSDPPPPPSSGGGGGSGVGFGTVSMLNPTRVIILGMAYPDSNIHLLRDGEEADVVRANRNAEFNFNLENITPGSTTFGFWAEDANGIRSILLTTTFQVTQNAATTVSGIFLPPTLQIDAKQITQGSPIKFSGQTVPGAKVEISVNPEDGSEAIKRIEGESSQDVGIWNIEMDSEELENEAFHIARTLFYATSSQGTLVQSGFGKSTSFYVGTQELSDVVSADLNNDGKINIIDFSMLIFHWGTDELIADLNQDGTVNLTDFSILVFNWTG